jgi:SNF2 family DNA or RNA helicase
VIDGLRSDLWSHQRRAVELATPHYSYMLAMDMGTGKSITALALSRVWDARRILIACPNSVVGVWPREITKHISATVRVARCQGAVSPKTGKLRTLSVADKAKIARNAMDISRVDGTPCFVVVNHESVWREPFASLVRRGDFDMVILDESHRAKSPSGKFSRFLAGLTHVRYRLALTGTPMPRSQLDAFAQYRFLDARIFGKSVVSFRRKYAIMGGYQNHQIVGWRNMEDFTQKFGSIAYQVKKEDCLDLPPTTDSVRLVELEDDARKTYEDLRKKFMAVVGEGVLTVPNALVHLLRLQQVASGVMPLDDGKTVPVSSAKRVALEHFLGDLPEDEPVVVFARFRSDLDQIERAAYATGRVYSELSGRRKDLTRDATMPEGVNVLGAQLQSGGVGIDLTRACHAVYFSHGWNLGDLLQSRARLDRPGQTRPVTYTHLLARGTVDEGAYAALQAREEMVEAVLAKARNGDSYPPSKGWVVPPVEGVDR